jgi:hypothetical protein
MFRTSRRHSATEYATHKNSKKDPPEKGRSVCDNPPHWHRWFALRHLDLSVRTTAPRQHWIMIVSITQPRFILFETTYAPEYERRGLARVLQKALLPGWEKQKRLELAGDLQEVHACTLVSVFDAQTHLLCMPLGGTVGAKHHCYAE